jgi:opacity protein-like surface antigen
MHHNGSLTATGAEVKKLFVGSALIIAAAMSAPARAADIGPLSMARGPIIGGFDWEGFYVGGHIGSATNSVSFNQNDVGWSNFSIVGPPPGPGILVGGSDINTGESGSLGATNVTGGLQIGYNWILPGPFLVGLEADISGTGLSSTTLTSPPGDPLAVASWNEKLDVYGSVRTRLGWVSDNWLFYGTGGFGWAYDKFTRNQLTAPFTSLVGSPGPPPCPPCVDRNALQAGTVVTSSQMRPGWVVGAGAEWAFARTWTIKLEYLHFDTASEAIIAGHFNNLSLCQPPAGNNPCPRPAAQASSSVTFSQGDLTIDTVRIGFNHTFN